MTNEANVFPNSGINPTVNFSDDSKANLGLCFSGGGSRALTCAWGQLLGLTTLGVNTAPRYISSVSGGTWASSIYTFLPSTISDTDLLGGYHQPEELSLSGDDGTFNVNILGPYNLGKAPEGMTLASLAATFGFFTYWYRNEQDNYKWLWASIVSEYVLKPFNLQAGGKELWTSENSFSLSISYANKYFPQKAPSTDEFFFVAPERPFLIMNDNIMEIVPSSGNIVQLPNQATAVSAGALGQTPDGSISGGGSVESYGYNSSLDQSSAYQSPVDIIINTPYSLIDCVSTSSAFFAETLAQYFSSQISDAQKRSSLVAEISKKLSGDQKQSILSEIKTDITTHIEEALVEILEKDAFNPASFVPTYNYWPIRENSDNVQTKYTDGGTLDNTGVVGMLAQTDTGTSDQPTISLIVFDNTDTPLEKVSGNIIAGSQAAPLFGIDFSTETGVYQPFTSNQQDPANADFEATSLIQVFDNTANLDTGITPFSSLNAALYATNCGAEQGQVPDDGKVNTAPAFFQATLTTVANSLANVTAGRTVNVLYIQNAKMLNWQNKIGDSELQTAIANGQKSSAGELDDFKNFPYYSTFYKIGLEAKESNALSQMWAWALNSQDSALTSALTQFIDNA